jgi:hypothetical protein
MLKLTARVLFLTITAACSLTPVNADVFEYGERQIIRGGTFNQPIFLKSDAEWMSTRFGRVLHLSADEKAIPPGVKNGARAAAVMDFTQETPQGTPQGVQVNSFRFSFIKGKNGFIFRTTTDPIVRVQYRTNFDIKYVTLPLQKTGGTEDGGYAIVSYSADDLKKFGLQPLYTHIIRIAVVAKPQVNNLIDDYADMNVKNFQYAPFTTKKLVTPLLDFDTRTDTEGDPLLTGA